MAATGTRERILRGTFEVLSRAGTRRLSLSEVAAEAGVSRPTLYRHFPSKDALLAAFGRHELERFDDGLRAATSGLTGAERLDAVLRFVVAFQQRYSLRHLAEVEPEVVLREAAEVLPLLQARLASYLHGDEVAAGAVVRLALSHYLLPGAGPEQMLRQLRHAAGT
jgi:AcrR family transcriptional regulator